MEKIKTLLVDDEKDSREVLSSLLTKYFPEALLVSEASNVADAYELINSKKPQLVFLDIQMPGLTGFDLLKKFERVPFKVVFVTSFDKYAIDAIKFSALDYLLKPIEIEEFKATIRKIKENIGQDTDNQTQVINLLHNLGSDIIERKIAVHAGEKVKFISELNVLYIEADGRYCDIRMSTGESYTVAKNLKEFEDYFERTNNFVRITKSFVINVHHIRSYNKGEPCFIEMTDGRVFEVARRKKTEVIEKLKQKNK